jgi:predicted AAA+ superfamily ATPase
VTSALASLPVVVVTGLRQAGKTTFLLEEPRLEGRRYYTLDDFATLEAARREPEGLIDGDGPVTIDEAQRSPELLTVIKRAVDRRRTPGRILLSGSANLALLEGVSESLAGRAVYLTLRPFTRREAEGRLSAPPFLTRFLSEKTLSGIRGAEPIDEDEVTAGGLPPVVLGEARDPTLWFRGYEQTYLERDVRQLARVSDLVSFRNLVRLAALRTGQVLNQSELARDAGLPVSTVARHLGLLEASFVVSRLPPFLRSRVSRLIKSPKIFVSDSGLAASLTGVETLAPTAAEPMRGPLFETYVYQNVAAILEAHAPRAELSFWSVQGRYEVDFVISQGRAAVGIEVKAGTRYRDADLSGLRAFVAGAPETRAGILAYNGTEALRIGQGLFAVPLGLLLS